MLKLADLPNICMSTLNMLCADSVQLSFLSKAVPIFDKIFQGTIQSLSVKPVERSSNEAPYIFYIDNFEAAIELDATELVSLASEIPLELDDFQVKMQNLKEEHLILQLVGILRELVFYNHNIAFRGKVIEEKFLETNCIEIEFLYVKNSVTYKGYINLLLPGDLRVENRNQEDIKSPINDLVSLHSLERVNIQVFLGILFIEPISLVEIFSVGNSFRIPDNMSFSECLLLVEYETAFMGSLYNSNNNMVFRYKNSKIVSLNGAPNGYSSVFIRIHNGEISIDQMQNFYPYLPIGTNFCNQVDMLIGGELVSRGVLEQRDDGMFIKVC